MKVVNLFVIFYFIFICGENLYAQPKLHPISCKLQMYGNGFAASWRGDATKKTPIELERSRYSYKSFIRNLEGNNEITDAELEEVLDRVYVKEINKTADEIKDNVYKSCIAKTKEKSAFGKKIPSMVDIQTNQSIAKKVLN